MPINPFGVAVVAVIGATIMTVFGPIAKAYAKRMGNENNSPRIDRDLESRLARIEHAVESIAVEIERVSEGQRFTTKLLSEQRGAGAHAEGEKR